MAVADKTFLEFVGGLGLFASILANSNATNAKKFKKVSRTEYIWRPGQAGEQTYTFAEDVTRLEAYLFALYEHRGGTGEFVPFPDPE